MARISDTEYANLLQKIANINAAVGSGPLADVAAITVQLNAATQAIVPGASAIAIAITPAQNRFQATVAKSGGSQSGEVYSGMIADLPPAA